MKFEDQYSLMELSNQTRDHSIQESNRSKPPRISALKTTYAADNEYNIFPVPKNIIYQSGSFNVNLELTLFSNFNSEFIPETIRNIRMKSISLCSEQKSCTQKIFFLAKESLENAFDITGKYEPEEYFLRINQDGILLCAGDYRGMINAMATLDCMLHQTVDGYLRYCEVRDKPDLKLRGTMLCLHQMHDFMPYFGPDSQTITGIFLDTLFQAKLNCLLIEYEAFYPWGGEHARISCQEAFTEEQINKLNRSAAKRGIEIIPLVQTLGHVYHILIHEAYKDCAEDQEYPQQLCPLSDKSYKLATELIDDTMRLHPDSRYIHLGGDECRRLGVCPACAEFSSKYGKYWLYAEYYKKITDYVLSKGCIPILWHDIAIKQPEVLEKFDKRVVFQFWNYGDVSHGVAKPQLTRLRKFCSESQIIGGSAARAARNHGCLHPSYAIISTNIREMNHYMFDCGAKGTIMTDWPDSGMTYFASVMPCQLQGETAWNTTQDHYTAFRHDYARFRFGIEAPELFDKLDALYGMMPFSSAFQSQLKSHLNRYDFMKYDFNSVTEKIKRIMNDGYAETELYKIFARRLLCLELEKYLVEKLEQCKYNRYELEYYELINKITIMFASMTIGMMRGMSFISDGCIPDEYMIDCAGVENDLKRCLEDWDLLKKEFFEFYSRYSVVPLLKNYLEMLFKPEIKDGLEAFLKKIMSGKYEN